MGQVARPQSRTKTGNRYAVFSLTRFLFPETSTTSRKPGALFQPFSTPSFFYFFNFNPKKHQIDFLGPHSTHMWRFDRTLTPHRACHAPLSSFLYFCTHLHASSPPPVHLFWPTSSEMTFLPSFLCPTPMVKITREPKLFLTKYTHPNKGCAPPPQ